MRRGGAFWGAALAAVGAACREHTSMLAKRSSLDGGYWVFLLPGAIALLLVIIIPFIANVAISFTEWNGITSPTWVGIANYERAAHDRTFWLSFENNLYIIVAMTRLIVAHPAWSPNQERSRVWHGPEGLFIVWPNAVTEMRKLLEEDELPGIPQSPQTILEILTGAGVLVPASTTNPLWSISPPPGKTAVEAVRLSSPEILLPAHSDHKSRPEPLIAPGGAAKAAPKPPEKSGEPRPLDQRELPLSEPVQTQSPKGPNVVIT